MTAANPPVQPARHAHIPALDGLRGLAILMVLAVHLVYLGALTDSSKARHLINAALNSGWAGVDLFFVLSGFLITGILLDTKESPNRAKSFYARRMLRIFPLYYLAVFGLMILGPRFSSLAPLYPTPLGWASYLFYFQNWYMPVAEPTHGILNHFWSLGIEEQFYLFWPFLVWRLSQRALVRTCVGGCIGVLILRCFLAHASPGSTVVLMNTVTRMDTLLVGAFCAIAVRDATLLAKVKIAMPFVAVFCFLGMLWIDCVAGEIWTRAFYTQSIGFTLLALGFGSLVLYGYLQTGSGTIFETVLSFWPLRVFGKYSYGIYVYQGVVFFAAQQMFQRRGILFSVSLVLASLGVATLSFHLFESLFLRYKKLYPAAPR